MSNRKRKLEQKIVTLEDALKSAKLNTSELNYENLMQKAKAVPKAIYDGIAKRTKYSEYSDNDVYYPGTAYPQEIKEFALSLHNCSPAGYRVVRSALQNILPSERTISRWMLKVDGSPGFSDQVKLF